MDKTQQFEQRYDLCIQLHQKKQALSEWEAFNKFLAQLQAIDPMIMMYPWQSQHTKGFPPISLTAAQQTLFDLEKYAPCLVSPSEAEEWLILVQRGYYNNPVPAYFSTSHRLF